MKQNTTKQASKQTSKQNWAKQKLQQWGTILFRNFLFVVLGIKANTFKLLLFILRQDLQIIFFLQIIMFPRPTSNLWSSYLSLEVCWDYWARNYFIRVGDFSMNRAPFWIEQGPAGIYSQGTEEGLGIKKLRRETWETGEFWLNRFSNTRPGNGINRPRSQGWALKKRKALSLQVTWLRSYSLLWFG